MHGGFESCIYAVMKLHQVMEGNELVLANPISRAYFPVGASWTWFNVSVVGDMHTLIHRANLQVSSTKFKFSRW